MQVIPTDLEGVKIIEPQVFGDARGWFVEQYNAARYKAAGIDADFVQDNNRRQCFIPRGFAHGFIVLEDDTLFCYKCDNFYCPTADRGVRFDDPALGIAWPDIGFPLTLSEKDRRHPMLDAIEPWEDIRGESLG